MKLIVDANIIFSFLIKQGKTAELLTNLLFEFYAPEYLFSEKTKEQVHDLIKDIDENIMQKLTVLAERIEFIDHLLALRRLLYDKKEIEKSP